MAALHRARVPAAVALHRMDAVMLHRVPVALHHRLAVMPHRMAVALHRVGVMPHRMPGVAPHRMGVMLHGMAVVLHRGSVPVGRARRRDRHGNGRSGDERGGETSG
jgi:hypothetical protein